MEQIAGLNGEVDDLTALRAMKKGNGLCVPRPRAGCSVGFMGHLF